MKLQLSPHKIFQIGSSPESSDLFLERPVSFVDIVEEKKLEVLSPYGTLALNSPYLLPAHSF